MVFPFSAISKIKQYLRWFLKSFWDMPLFWNSFNEAHDLLDVGKPYFKTCFCKENCWTCFNLKGIVWDQWTGSFTLLEYLSDRFVLIHLFQIWWSPNLWHPLEYFNSEAGYFRSITHIAGIVDIWNYCANGVVFVCLYLYLCLKRSNQANGVVFVRHIFSSALDFWWSTTCSVHCFGQRVHIFSIFF